MADQAPTPSNAPATAEQKPASDQQMPATVDPKPTMTKQEPAAKRKSKRKKDRSSKEAKQGRIEKRKRYKAQSKTRPRDPAAEAYLAQCKEDRKERKRKAREEKAAEKERLKKLKVEHASAGPVEAPTQSTQDHPVCIHCRQRFDPKDYRLPYSCSGNRRKSPAETSTQVSSLPIITNLPADPYAYIDHPSIYEKVTLEFGPRKIGGDIEYEDRERWRCCGQQDEKHPGCV